MLLEMNVKLRRGHFDLTTQLSISDSNVGLFGKSGAGKSTVLGLIAGTLFSLKADRLCWMAKFCSTAVKAS